MFPDAPSTQHIQQSGYTYELNATSHYTSSFKAL